MKFIVEIPDGANLDAEDVRTAIRFGLVYWDDITQEHADQIAVKVDDAGVEGRKP